MRRIDREWYATLWPLINSDRSSVIVTVIHGPIDLLGRQMITTDDGRVIDSIGEKIDRAVLAAAQEAVCLAPMYAFPTSIA